MVAHRLVAARCRGARPLRGLRRGTVKQASNGTRYFLVDVADPPPRNATLAFKAGIHPRVVQERLGHANVGITLNT